MKEIQAEIIDLQIQPLKGGGPLKLAEARITPSGMETVDGRVKDHSLVVVSDEVDIEGCHNFLTQRKRKDPKINLFVPGDPRLCLIKPDYTEEGLLLRFGGSEVLDPGEEGDYLKYKILVQVWEYRGKAVEVPILSEFISDCLGRKLRVARTSGGWDRMTRQNYLKNDNPLKAQDGYPIHVVSKEDVDLIFEALGATTDPNRFRYQVLLGGLPVRAIHGFEQVVINRMITWQPKPCARCEVTGIDQETGEFSKIKPLSGLSKAGMGRWIKNETEREHVIGENWLPQGKAKVKIGDTVIFRYKNNDRVIFEER